VAIIATTPRRETTSATINGASSAKRRDRDRERAFIDIINIPDLIKIGAAKPRGSGFSLIASQPAIAGRNI